jgi:hypothetical protein
MKALVQMDARNRIALSRELREVAGICRGQKLRASATVGRIVLEVQANQGRVLKRGKFKVWIGEVPTIPLEDAIKRVRSYKR